MCNLLIYKLQRVIHINTLYYLNTITYKYTINVKIIICIYLKLWISHFKIIILENWQKGAKYVLIIFIIQDNI